MTNNSKQEIEKEVERVMTNFVGGSNQIEQIYSTVKKTRELVSSINAKILRREFKEPGFCEIVEENGKCFLKLNNIEITGITKNMADLRRILNERKDSIRRLLKNYLEVQT